MTILKAKIVIHELSIKFSYDMFDISKNNFYPFD